MIRTVVFGVGNVLVDFALDQLVAQLSHNSTAGERRIGQVVSGSELEKSYSRGEISSEQFLQGLKSKLNLDMDLAEIAEVYSRVFEPKEEVLSLVRDFEG